MKRKRFAAHSSDDRHHHHPRASPRCWRKRGTQKQGFGRSKGGFTTKIHLCTNAQGLPICAEITGGEVSDYKGFNLVMGDPETRPRVLIADKGYDADYIRDVVEQDGGVAVIPPRRTRKTPRPIDDHIYALRNQIERCFNRLKNSRRLATRYDKTAESYLGFVNLSAVRLWIRHFVNTT